MRGVSLTGQERATITGVVVVHYLILTAIGALLLGAVSFALMSEADHLSLRAKIDAIRTIWSANRGEAAKRLASQSNEHASECKP